jgi:predicted RNA-binding Zn ribbon-like protein
MSTRGRPRKRASDERPAFSWIGGALCLDFVNTVTWAAPGELLNERFVTAGDVLEWARSAGRLPEGEPEPLSSETAEALLHQAHHARAVLHDVLLHAAGGLAPSLAMIDSLNELIRWCTNRLRLVPEGNEAWLWQVESPSGADDRHATHVLAPVVYSAVDLLRSTELLALRNCANPHCGWLFLDRSRKGNRRWCEMRECGSRAKARRYYQRRRTEAHHQA